jgi:hypothetical protein
MVSIQPRQTIAELKIHKDDDIIPISVGLYKLFLAGGSAGLEAKTLYEHLIFTARLQETQQVFANNEYLRAGLQWGIAKVKKAKAWLVEAGLIEYVQYRDIRGTLSGVYIRIKFMLSRETLNEKLSHIAPDGWVPPSPPEAVPAPDNQCSFDFSEDPTEVSNSVIDINFTAGTVTAPPVSRTTGYEQQMLEANNQMLEANNQMLEANNQMLEANNQMLETKNEMSVSPASAESVDPVSESIDRVLTDAGTSRPFQIRPNQSEAIIAEKVARMLCRLWYARYHKETARMQLPGPQDLAEASKVVISSPNSLRRVPGLLASPGPSIIISTFGAAPGTS